MGILRRQVEQAEEEGERHYKLILSQTDKASLIAIVGGGETPKEQFRREVEKELTGRETDSWEIIYFKLYKSQIPVIEQALETAALMLGSDRSRGYCLEMIWADFLAGANLENENPTVLLQSISRFFKFLPGEQRQAFLHEVTEKAS